MGLFERVLSVFKSADTAAAPTPTVKPGRNDECWCGSGRKYKKCHLPEDEQHAMAKSCSLACGPK
jgi:SEC-C motif-containing protein